MKERIKKIEQNCKHDIILLNYAGSISYGTNIATSDIDLRGICLQNKNELLGLARFEQYEDKVEDTTIYGVNKIFKLLLNANPNVIELLGVDLIHILKITDEGRLLVDNSDLFITQRCINSFGGYAVSQLRRMENALARDATPEKKEEHVLGSITNSFPHLQEHYQEFSDEEIKIYIDKSQKEEYSTEIMLDINLKGYPLRDFMNIFSEMSQTLRSYDKIGKRNKKKDDPSLLKHALHLIRLYLMCTDMLEGKGICTYRKDRAFLLDIRNGVYSFQDIFDMVDEFQKKMEYAIKHTNLPKKPDYKKVEELLMEINERTVK